MNNKVIMVLWECQDCRSRGRSQKGYYIRCDGDKCETNSFKILDVYTEEKSETKRSPFLNKTKVEE